MSAPRKIWANVIVESNGVGLCGEWNHADCGHLEDEVYHHDDVVRELSGIASHAIDQWESCIESEYAGTSSYDYMI
ncbi:hypothetical protein QVM29_32350, partial [Pseudomonas aeruginosa]|uniref:hypothetical protein n=1 Tax=Pseudomonas aeruginosa TaxID=287 RepID=UPI003525577E